MQAHAQPPHACNMHARASASCPVNSHQDGCSRAQCATAAQPRAGARSAAAARCSSSINTPARVRAHARTMWLIARYMRAHPRGAPAEQRRTSEEASEIHRRCHHHHHHHHNNNSNHGRHHTCHHNLNKKSAQQPSPRTTQGAGARTRPFARTKRARLHKRVRQPAAQLSPLSRGPQLRCTISSIRAGRRARPGRREPVVPSGVGRNGTRHVICSKV